MKRHLLLHEKSSMSKAERQKLERAPVADSFRQSLGKYVPKHSATNRGCRECKAQASRQTGRQAGKPARTNPDRSDRIATVLLLRESGLCEVIGDIAIAGNSPKETGSPNTRHLLDHGMDTERQTHTHVYTHTPTNTSKSVAPSRMQLVQPHFVWFEERAVHPGKSARARHTESLKQSTGLESPALTT